MQLNTSLSPYILTADIGGSHITAAICNVTNNTVDHNTLVRADVMSHRSAEDILAAWGDAFKQVAENFSSPIRGVGLAMPGPFDYQRGISYIKGINKYDSLYGMNITQFMVDTLQMDPACIKFRNDAEATIAGEVLGGAGKGHKNVVGITLGTGFGSAQCKDGVNIDLDLGARPYKDSIADDHLSTRWFLKRYSELSGMSVMGVKELASIASNSKIAQQVFREFAHNMAEFLNPTLNELKPDVLIICGNIARAHAYFLPEFKKQISTPVQLAQLGEDAALIGAAGLFEPIKVPLASL